jgi:hypothetical protein
MLVKEADKGLGQPFDRWLNKGNKFNTFARPDDSEDIN